jgi:hypothetical protein
VIAIDGTKVSANANRDRTVHYDQLERAIVEEGISTDSAETAALGERRSDESPASRRPVMAIPARRPLEGAPPGVGAVPQGDAHVGIAEEGAVTGRRHHGVEASVDSAPRCRAGARRGPDRVPLKLALLPFVA